MRKTYLYVTIITTLICGTLFAHSTTKVENKTTHNTYSNKATVSACGYEVRIQKVTFSGHSYIIFRGGYEGGVAVIHDPDCQCQKSK